MVLSEQLELVKKSPLHWEIVLNRPDKYNALTSDMYEGITQILEEAANDEQLVLLSITGKGKFYCAGTDLMDSAKAMMTSDDTEAAMEIGSTRVKKFIDRFITFPKILIGFINGPTIGVGVTTLGLFDAVYASPSATFSLPFIRTAQAPEGCSSFLFPILMGSLHAKEILLFDRKLTADEAQQRGLVTRVIDDRIFQEEKDRICKEIVSLPKGSLLSSKALIQRWNINTLKYVNEEEFRNLKQQWVTEEFAAAMMKFMESRKKSKL